jgi:hypothetical protein
LKAELDILLFFVFAFVFILWNEFMLPFLIIPIGEENNLVWQKQSITYNMVSGLGSMGLMGGGLYFASEIYGTVYGYPKWVTKKIKFGGKKKNGIG